MSKLARTAGAAAVLALAGISAIVVPASASSLPFNDPSVNGYIAFCDAHGNTLTSGSVGTAPFAWTAQSSTPAPSGFAQGKVTLYAFQPRPGVPPGDWNGEQLTGSSTFSNPAHPMSQATPRDRALQDVVGAFPPMVDGLYQIRMYFTAVNSPTHTSPYPASVIQVNGSTWKVVLGGTLPCNTGKATSDEGALGVTAPTVPPSAYHDPGYIPTTTVKSGSSCAGGTAATCQTGASAAARSTTSSTTFAVPAGGSLVASGVGGGSSGGLSGGALAGIIGGAVVVLGTGAVVLSRRRRSSRSSS
jgi:hypothetical protein